MSVSKWNTPPMTKEQLEEATTKIGEHIEWETKLNLKVCESCMWRLYYHEIVENPICELGITMGSLCAGYQHYSTMIVICTDCCKKISLDRLKTAGVAVGGMA